MTNDRGEHVKLDFSSVAFFPEVVMELLLSLWKDGLLHGPTTIAGRQHHLLGANPHYVEFGVARLLQQVLETQFEAHAVDPGAPSFEELRALFDRAPQLREYFRLSRRGDDWTLKFVSTPRPLRRRDWASRSWRVAFETSEKRSFFPLARGEFAAFGEMLSCLDGSFTPVALRRRFKDHAALLARFLEFANAQRLLTTPAARQAPRAPPGVELFSHSMLDLRSESTNILIDPCLHLLDHTGASPTDRARLSRKLEELRRATAVLISHAHWDHCHIPTLLRLQRDVPVYVPKVVTESYFNPSIKNLLVSLGFTNVREVTHWKRYEIGDATFTPIPFFGEWFGPGSSFDGFCYLVAMNGRTYLGTVDADRSERGDMKPVFEELARRAPDIDCMFFCSSAQAHQRPVSCGAPIHYSNTHARRFADRLRYHPDVDAVAGWCRTLRPRVIVPYAEFIFSHATPRPPFSLDAFGEREAFADYWRALELPGQGGQRAKRVWKASLQRLMAAVRPLGTKLLMLGPGESIAESAAGEARAWAS